MELNFSTRYQSQVYYCLLSNSTVSWLNSTARPIWPRGPKLKSYKTTGKHIDHAWRYQNRTSKTGLLSTTRQNKATFFTITLPRFPTCLFPSTRTRPSSCPIECSKRARQANDVPSYSCSPRQNER